MIFIYQSSGSFILQQQNIAKAIQTPSVTLEWSENKSANNQFSEQNIHSEAC